MRSLGIVDIGSNTARLVVYRYESPSWFRLIDDIREPIRLGEGLWLRNKLRRSAVQRAVAALKSFLDYAQVAQLDELVVAGTSALRDAPNREIFDEAVSELGLDVRTLDGSEEAELGVLAVANGFLFEDAWVMDLGGGSAQLSRMKGRQFAEGVAYPLGGVRLTETLLRSDPPRPGEVAAVERFIAEQLGGVAKRLRSEQLPLVAMGGSVRNLARAVQVRRNYPLRLLHGYWLSRRDLEKLTKDLLRTDLQQRLRMRGISSVRADLICAPALVFRWLLRAADLEGLWVSGYGVREGLLYTRFLPAPHLVDDVRKFSLHNLFQRAPQPLNHVEHVRFLARRLFDELAPLHGLGEPEAQVLDAAACLHDIGTAISYYYHHQHGSYFIGSWPLSGFSHREQALIALLVRYHHKGNPNRQGLDDIVPKRDRRLLLRLAVCLRLAEYLERSRAGRVVDVRAEWSGDAIRLSLSSRAEPTVEIWETKKQEPLVRRAFGRRLALEWEEL